MNFVEVNGTALHAYEVTPEEVGLERAAYADVAGGPPAANADTARRILAGEAGPSRDLAVLNAAAAIYAAGRADSLERGVRAAEETLDSGAAARALDRLVELTSKLAPT